MPQENIALLAVITVVYLLIIGYLGYHGYRRTRTATDYMVAGRGIHPYIMALSYGATFISTSAIVGFGGAAGLFGFGLLWLTFLNILVGIFIAFVVFGKRTRRMGHNLEAHTFPELLGRRYRSRFIQVFSGLVIFFFMPLYAAVVLIGGARFIEETFGMNFDVALFVFSLIIAAYVIMGGLKAVMYTDAFQGSIMLIGMFILLLVTYSKLGGVVESHSALTALSNMVPEGLAKGGHQGWTAMPKAGSPIWWTLVSTIIMGVGIGVLAQPQLAVRFMTVRSNRELNRAVLIGGVFVLMMTGVAFVVGSLSNVYFVQHAEFGKISVAAAGGNIDKIIPIYINSAMPTWFVYIFMLTLLAAAMSTVSSQFHAMGTAAGRDIYEQLGEKRGRGERTVFFTRMGIIVTIVLTIMLGYILPGSVIARGTAIFFALCAAAFLPMFFAALFWRRMTRAGAAWGMVVGFAVSLFWVLFIHQKNAGDVGLCKLIFGKVCLAGFPWNTVDALFIALPASIVVTLVITLISQPPPKQYVEQCFRGL